MNNFTGSFLYFILVLVVGYFIGAFIGRADESRIQADSIEVLNSIIELDIRTIRAQNDTNWMYRDSTSYFRTKFLVKRESLWLCLERGR